MLAYFTLTRTREENANKLPLFSKLNPGGLFTIGSTQQFFVEARTALSIVHLIIFISFAVVFGVYLGFSLTYTSNVEILNLVIHAPVFSSEKGPISFISTILIHQYYVWIPVIVFLGAAVLFQLYPLAFSGDSFVNRYTASKKKGGSSVKNDKDALINEDESKEVYSVGQSNEDYSVGVILYGNDWYNWIMFDGIVLSIVLWVLAHSLGITDIIMLVTIVTLHFLSCIYGGYGFEFVNNSMTLFNRLSVCQYDAKEAGSGNVVEPKEIRMDDFNWNPYIFGLLIPSLLIHGYILTYFIVMLQSGTLSWFYWASAITLFTLFIILEVVLIPLFYGIILPKNCKEIFNQAEKTEGDFRQKAYFYEKTLIRHNMWYNLIKILLQAAIVISFGIFLTVVILYK